MATFEYELGVMPEGKRVGHLLHGTVTVERRVEELAEERLYEIIQDKYGYPRDAVYKMSLNLLDEE